MLSNIKNKVLSYTKAVIGWLSKIIAELNNHPIRHLLIVALLATIIIEIFNRRSLIGWLLTFSQNPLMFIYNYLIILITLSIGLFFTRKNFILLLVSTVWISLALSNYIMLGYRTTPLTAIDFKLFTSVVSIINMYLSTFKIILFIGMFVLAIMFIIYTYRILAKTQVRLKSAVITVLVIVVSMISLFNISTKLNARSDNFGNIAEAFQSYGFAYCFATSIIDHGINQPKDYSQEVVANVLETIDQDKRLSSNNIKDQAIDSYNNQSQDTTITEVTNTSTDLSDDSQYGILFSSDVDSPNIIMVQLESFFDVNHLVNYTYSENPIPNFTQLKETFSSGFLSVPTIGAGTANTEFEVLSGMNLDYFGAGEYPYKTILTESTVESICYDLDELGYHNHAIHNNVGTFYSRNEVYPMLGFDSFSSLEFMNNVTYNPLGWVKDEVLTDEIMGALKYTEEQDFIFTVSVQPHGKYPDEPVDDSQFITIGLSEEAEATYEMSDIEKSQYEYYLNQLYETDAFISALLDELSAYDEPVVVVFYGDHLPAFEIEDESLTNNDKFQTEYVLWSNFPMEKVEKDLSAYQLGAYVMERLGLDNGILTKFHQTSSQLPNYQEELLLLQYDMLYGDLNVYDGVNPHPVKPMTMGYQPLTISKVEIKGDALVVSGNPFTKWSKVLINGEIMDTLYLDSNTLIVPYGLVNIEDTLTVGQIGSKDLILSESDPWVATSDMTPE